MATTDQKPDTLGEINSQAIALAEQLGRIAGTLEGTAESWLNRASITDQLTKVRDGATQLLNSLGAGVSSGRKSAQEKSQTQGQKTSGRRAGTARAASDPAHAPGKRHRKPSPSMRGVKKSDAKIPKMRTAAEMRRRRKSYA